MGCIVSTRRIVSVSTDVVEPVKLDEYVELNKKASEIMKTQGQDATFKFMMNPTGDRPLSYAESRALFG